MKSSFPIIRLITIVFLLIQNGCSSSKEMEVVPWQHLSWINRADTKINIYNSKETKQHLSLQYFNKTSRESIDVEKEIPAGKHISFTLSLYRPELIKLILNDTVVDSYIIPGKDMNLRIEDNLSAISENSHTYNYLLNIGDHKLEESEFLTLSKSSNLAKWLIDFTRESREMYALYHIYQQAGYQLFGGNTMSPIDYKGRADSILANFESGQYHNYFTLLQSYKFNYDLLLSDPDSKEGNWNYNRRKYLFDQLFEIPEESIRSNLLAIHLEGSLIRKRKYFDKKEDLYAAVISNIPDRFVYKLNSIEKSLVDEPYSASEIVSRIDQPLTSMNGIVTPLSINSKFRLFKFWFAGCAPCKKQIPYEIDLIESYPNLELITFCYATGKDEWKNYIEKNMQPGHHFFLDPIAFEGFQKTFQLSYAPRYILLNNQNEVLCWECANPNDQGLNQYLDQ